MIQSDPQPKEHASVLSAPSVASATPSTSSSIPKVTTQVPPAPKQGGIKKPTIILLAVLFIAAIAGGLLAFQNFSKTADVDLSKQDETLAWRPVTVLGTCTGLRVIGNAEPAPHSFNFTFVLSNGSRSGTLQHKFDSKPIDGGHKIDEDVTWASLGEEGSAFASLIRTKDVINWQVTVTYMQDGQEVTENHADAFTVEDLACNATASASPTASPSSSALATATASPAATRTATPAPTASPRPTDPAIGGENDPTPSPTPTRSPSPTPSATIKPSATAVPATTAPTPVAQATNPPTGVADSEVEQLPTAGVPYGILFMGIGSISMAISAAFALSRKRY